MTHAVLATYPARTRFIFKTVQSLLAQVEELTVVANEFEPGEIDAFLPAGVKIVYPPRDLKDVGKFYLTFPQDQFIALCDDDIIYPNDYVARLQKDYRRFESLNPIVGVHGVVYSDFFDGKPESRLVHVFTDRLDQPQFVNQLGTGTVLCRGHQLPPFSFMDGSARFVDLRFAVHCHRHGFPRICVAREKQWMSDQETGSSLFSSFTQIWPESVTREAQEIAGVRFLPDNDALLVPQAS